MCECVWVRRKWFQMWAIVNKNRYAAIVSCRKNYSFFHSLLVPVRSQFVFGFRLFLFSHHRIVCIDWHDAVDIIILSTKWRETNETRVKSFWSMNAISFKFIKYSRSRARRNSAQRMKMATEASRVKRTRIQCRDKCNEQVKLKKFIECWQRRRQWQRPRLKEKGQTKGSMTDWRHKFQKIPTTIDDCDEDDDEDDNSWCQSRFDCQASDSRPFPHKVDEIQIAFGNWMRASNT